ncbi:hypothetical protein QYS48_06515 [Marivirga arenosa]|uniref:Tetratricopeptide repeat protein n=1 Tax=Marivirga arenosa TaxID=3059076 RepID=A0AA49JE43_9BACT|nr:hypothetical protein [Marivirga sp. ABR2-2]WKK86575.2 hypothetical protein QYS48_06515 [Marivirga sp. ABR2-2]
MKILILSIIIAFSGQNDFNKVDELVEQRKYSDAFSLLNELDPNNEKPDALRRKIDICVDNYIMSIGHQLFALKNLEDGEEIEELRGKEGNYDMFSLDVSSIAPPIMEKYPENYKLKFSVGRYYHSMHLNCGNCSMSAADCISEFERLFEECYENEVYDYFSTYGIAYAKINKQQFKESIPYFLKSIELKDGYPSSHYNLSYAYLYIDDHENCIKYAKKAFERYDYPAYKADAAKIAATAYKELQDLENAFKYYTIANDIYPGDYYTLAPLINLSLYLKKDEIKKLRDQFFLVDTDNPTIYDDLIQAYYDYADITDLLSYFESLKPKYKKDFATLGSLHFYTGKINLEAGNNEKGKELLSSAKTEFLKVYPEDHQVFPVIDQLLK